MAFKNKVQLITYPDSLGGNLQQLNDVLLRYFPDVFQGGVHILPPYPSSGDRGFAPLTYLEIEPDFGSWQDIRAISRQHDIMLDLMVNHISRQSPWFQDFLRNGRHSRFADLFLPLDKIWPGGKPDQKDMEKIFLRREQPFSSYRIESTGEEETLWTTFGKVTPSEQIDLDVNSPATRSLMKEFLANFSRNGIRFLRLDAIGYVIKKPGTSCFFVEPEIDEFLAWIAGEARALGIEVLPEVHAHYSTQFSLADKGYWIYDFILPYLVLETLLTRHSGKLLDYLRTRPHRQCTMLDCHDGIPVKPDLDDIVSTRDAEAVVAACLQRGANLSRIFSPSHRSSDGFDVHQIRCAYYSMLDCDDDAYLTARAIQFFTPGVPQVYYVGLLAGENDFQRVEATGEGREINRHNYSIDEIRHAVQKPVVQRLLHLIRYRNTHPAFDGEFSVLDSAPDEIRLQWQNGANRCVLIVDLHTRKSVIESFDSGEKLHQISV